MVSTAEMKQLREIAESYYKASSPELKAKAQEFFEAMDRDGDKKVDMEEFLSFMKHHGYARMWSSSFFKVLDETGHGALSFMDVMTLYYAIKSGRPFCDCCATFIPGTFFSCVHCFNATPNSSFDICLHCYNSNNCKHTHAADGTRALFLDNYTLLQATRHSSPPPPPPPPTPTPTTTTTMVKQPQTTASCGTGQSSRADVLLLPSSPSDDYATSVIKNEFNKVVAQSSWSDSRPLKRSATKNVATPSDPIINYVSPSSPRRTQDAPPSTAIVLATGPQRNGAWTDLASASFKALDKLIVVGNLAGLIAAAVTSGCTIM